MIGMIIAFIANKLHVVEVNFSFSIRFPDRAVQAASASRVHPECIYVIPSLTGNPETALINDGFVAGFPPSGLLKKPCCYWVTRILSDEAFVSKLFSRHKRDAHPRLTQGG
jgi:hypothetical protein